MKVYIIVYFCIGALVSIPLARIYWKNFRKSNHKANTVLPRMAKFDPNRIIDSFVFLIAWAIYTITYPFYLLGLLFKKKKYI